MEILEENDWISTSDIAKQLNQTNNVVSTSLRKLYEYDEILRRNIPGRGYEWKGLK